ncbi:hypothetical protein ABZV67_44070 [Streptomyces sp. NPDC005065]|uniref:hypothetical protein n=1 Tax=Streptomyces sp. NPDC005065 TaxID=3154461 RepID=UPI0033AD9CE2
MKGADPPDRQRCRQAGIDDSVAFETNDVGEAALRDWYRELDLLPGGIETVIGADSCLSETVDFILLGTGLAGLPVLER